MIVPDSEFVNTTVKMKIKEKQFDEFCKISTSVCDNVLDASIIDSQIDCIQKMSKHSKKKSNAIAKKIREHGKYDELIETKKKVMNDMMINVSQ
jgi:hypothetical protein